MDLADIPDAYKVIIIVHSPHLHLSLRHTAMRRVCPINVYVFKHDRDASMTWPVLHERPLFHVQQAYTLHVPL